MTGPADPGGAASSTAAPSDASKVNGAAAHRTAVNGTAVNGAAANGKIPHGALDDARFRDAVLDVLAAEDGMNAATVEDRVVASAVDESADVLPDGTTGQVRRGVALSAVSQVCAKLVHLALNIISTLAVVRYLDPGRYGVYAIVLSVTSVLTLVADFGLPKIAVRDITASTRGAASVVGTVVILRIALAAVGVGVSVLLMMALRQPTVAYPAAAIAALGGLGEGMLAGLVVVFQVRLAQQWEAILRTGAELLETAAILLLVVHKAALPWLFVPPTVCTTLAGFAAYLVVRRRFGVRPSFDRSQVGWLMRQAMPIAPCLLVGAAYRKLDTYSLAIFRPGRDVGIYSSAAQPVEYFLLTAALLMNTIFPLMSTAYGRGDIARFEMIYRRGAESLAVCTMVVPVVLLFMARPLASRVFGSAYASADTPLILLSFAVPPLCIAMWQSLALLLGGLQMVTLQYNLVTLVVAVLLCASLVPLFGIVGAGCAAIAISVVVFALSTRAVLRRMGARLALAPFARIVLAAALTVGVLFLVTWAALPWPAVAAAGLVGYVVALRCTGAHRSLSGLVT